MTQINTMQEALNYHLGKIDVKKNTVTVADCLDIVSSSFVLSRLKSQLRLYKAGKGWINKRKAKALINNLNMKTLIIIEEQCIEHLRTKTQNKNKALNLRNWISQEKKSRVQDIDKALGTWTFISDKINILKQKELTKEFDSFKDWCKERNEEKEYSSIYEDSQNIKTSKKLFNPEKIILEKGHKIAHIIEREKNSILMKGFKDWLAITCCIKGLTPEEVKNKFKNIPTK